MATATIMLALPDPGLAQDGEQVPEGLRVLGTLDTPKSHVNDGIVAFDAAGERMYYAYHENGLTSGDVHLVEYDLGPSVPQQVREGRLGTSREASGALQPESFAHDAERDRLYQLGYLQPPETHGGQGGFSVGGAVRAIDLETLEYTETWDLTAMGLPGFRSRGMAYSEEDGRVYLLGRYEAGMTAPTALLKISGLLAEVTVVVALDVRSGSIAWQRPVNECQAPGQRGTTASSRIARASSHAALYFFCATGGGEAANAYPGQPGVVRLHIGPDADQNDAPGFDVDYFPISGQYGTDQAAVVFDPATDRLFVTSLAPKTPGAFVFDGRLSAWIGKVAAPNGKGKFLAVSPGSGRLYLAGRPEDDRGRAPEDDGAFIKISDARATPPPQGVTHATELDPDLPNPNSVIAADPTRGRIFFHEPLNPDYDETGALYVVEDNTSVISEGDPVDRDSLTDDVPEGPHTSRTFNGSAAGFGSLVRLVGGVEDLASYRDGVSVSEAIAPVFQPSNGDRSVTGGMVKSTNVSAFSAEAGAQALRADGSTSGDYDALQREAGQPPRPLPYQLVECSDGGIDPGTKTDRDDLDSGHAEVTCDLSEELVTAEASHRVGTAEPDVDALAVAASHFDTQVRRDPELGIVTESVATAEGIQVPVPGVGTVRIDYVQSTASTQAAGRTGTSAARWTRVIDGLRVVDGDGRQQYPPADGSAPTSCATMVASDGEDTQQAGSCRQLLDGLNEVLQTRVQFRLAMPDLRATPKGAYAQVWEPEADFLQGQTVMGDDSHAVPALEAVVFADGTDKSRLVVQLAGIEATSLYTITDFSRPESSDPDDATPNDTQTIVDGQTTGPSDGQETVTVADLTGSDDGDDGQSTGPVQVSLPAQPVAADASASEGAGAETPAVAPPNAEPARGPLALLTLPGWHAARIFGVWALFVAAFVVAVRRGLLLQTTTGGNS